MRKLNAPLALSLLMLLASAIQAIPQTVPSDPKTGQMLVHQPRKPGSRSALAAAPSALPGLCFEPGVGWRHNFPAQPGLPRESNTLAGNGSTGGPPSNADRPFGDRLRTQQTRSTECTGVSRNEEVLSATLPSAGSTKPRTRASLQAHAQHHAHGSTALAKGTPGFMPSAPGYSAAENKPDTNPDQSSIRTYHAYISSIKLRRLIRNAPDFKTRIQLQQLENHPAKQLHRARAGTTKGARPREGERLSRSSSRKSDASAPAQDAHARLSGTDR
jgi:hypothetical protein